MRLATVVLAAGLGTRMKSSIPKVLHKLHGKPMIQYIADCISQLRAEKNIMVLGPQSEKIKDVLKDYPLIFTLQQQPKGTGDALKASLQQLKGFEGTIIIINGDTPLVKASTLKRFIRLHNTNKEDISIISFIAKEPHSYGRIVRDGAEIKAIVEDKDADIEQKKIREVNSGIYALKSNMLKLLKDIKINPLKGEYYLTDIVGIAKKKGYKIGVHILGNETEMTGINTREDLHNAIRYLTDRTVNRLMQEGVSFIDKASVLIHPDVKIGSDTVIYPNVYIEGKTIIGKGCTIYPNTRIISSRIGNNVVIKDSTIIESSSIKDDAVIGPFAHIRPESIIGSFTKIGNFVEIKKSEIGEHTKASHLSYIGDAKIGSNVNIGAGTITCNYDGNKKNKTVIESDVFVGSDSQLIAPVKIGRGAYIGAGSTITHDVPSMSLAISRVEQKNIKGWAKNRLKNKKKKEQNKK